MYLVSQDTLEYLIMGHYIYDREKLFVCVVLLFQCSGEMNKKYFIVVRPILTTICAARKGPAKVRPNQA